jgi:hypothetical protein
VKNGKCTSPPFPNYELEFDLKMVDKSEAQKSSPNSPATSTEEAMSTRITDLRMALESLTEARETMGKELEEEMRQLIDQAQMCLYIISINMKLYQAARDPV